MAHSRLIEREDIHAYLERLRSEEHFNEQEDEWQFLDGTACAVCTNSAMHIAQRFAGQVLGYDAHENPTACIGLPVDSGHDFALIQGRWLVDYWVWRVEALIVTAIFDFEVEADRLAVLRLYGDPEHWELVSIFDGHGKDFRIRGASACTARC